MSVSSSFVLRVPDASTFEQISSKVAFQSSAAEAEEAAICAAMGWTWGELQAQPAAFVTRLGVYLGAVVDARSRELEDGLRRMRA